jgi:hypothetical protein
MRTRRMRDSNPRGREPNPLCEPTFLTVRVVLVRRQGLGSITRWTQTNGGK